MRSFPGIGAFLLCAAAALFASGAQGGEFPLREGDVVVMAGDSITAQHMHSNYIEAYCVTRFPKWNLQFRNAGVNGDTIVLALARLDYDAFCWKPTVVTIELGMNDERFYYPAPVEPYIRQMEILIQRVQAAGARPVLFTASPLNNGMTGATMKGTQERLGQMANALLALAAKEKLPCADQFHALVDVWGDNFNSPNAIPLGGPNAVHPGPVGQMTMAYACLTGLGAPGLVSAATIDPDGKAAGINCVIRDLKSDENGISFERTDDCLPMPIPDDTRPALKLVPLSEKLNRYMLTVQFAKFDLLPEKWDISIDGAKVATLATAELWKGWNMSELTEGPIAAQCQTVLRLIRRKESAVSRYCDAAKRGGELDGLMKTVLSASAEINAAAQPKPHKFVIAPAK